ncbi:hypothetical protein ATERTT37_001893 [Aspergillus terreus]|jgi:hypothetical protein
MAHPETSHPIEATADARALQVKFDWLRNRGFIVNANSPDSDPIYTMHYNILKSRLTFKSAGDESPVGTGKLHPVSINADVEVHGRTGTMTAVKRLQPVYTYTSYFFSDDGSPKTMTWTSGSLFKSFDYVCLDENMLPVAKFTSKTLAWKNMGKIEFLGPKANDDAFRDEIVVTGMTLFWCIIQRSGNIFNLVGAAIHRPGKQKQGDNNVQQGA